MTIIVRLYSDSLGFVCSKTLDFVDRPKVGERIMMSGSSIASTFEDVEFLEFYVRSVTHVFPSDDKSQIVVECWSP